MSYWKQLSPALPAQSLGTCERNGTTDATLNAPWQVSYAIESAIVVVAAGKSSAGGATAATAGAAGASSDTTAVEVCRFQ